MLRRIGHHPHAGTSSSAADEPAGAWCGTVGVCACWFGLNARRVLSLDALCCLLMLAVVFWGADPSSTGGASEGASASVADPRSRRELEWDSVWERASCTYQHTACRPPFHVCVYVVRVSVLCLGAALSLADTAHGDV